MIAIVTAKNAGKLGKGEHNTAKLLGGPDIEHYHQAIAVVVAETFEQARAAARLVQVEYTRADGSFSLGWAKDRRSRLNPRQAVPPIRLSGILKRRSPPRL